MRRVIWTSVACLGMLSAVGCDRGALDEVVDVEPRTCESRARCETTDESVADEPGTSGDADPNAAAGGGSAPGGNGAPGESGGSNQPPQQGDRRTAPPAGGDTGTDELAALRSALSGRYLKIARSAYSPESHSGSGYSAEFWLCSYGYFELHEYEVSTSTQGSSDQSTTSFGNWSAIRQGSGLILRLDVLGSSNGSPNGQLDIPLTWDGRSGFTLASLSCETRSAQVDCDALLPQLGGQWPSR